MKFTMIAMGTRGDLQPALALGKALQARGHQIRIFAGVNFRSWIESHGFEAAPTAVNLQALMNSEGGKAWVERGHNPIVQLRLMKKLLDAHGPEIAWDAWQACQGTDVIISSFTSDVYVTAIAEKLGVPQINMLFQPSSVATREGQAVLNGPLPQRNSAINYWFGKMLLEHATWQLLGDLTQQLRRKLSLPPQSEKENRAVRQQMLVLHGYSSHVVPHPADWPPDFHTTGYWFLDEQTDWQPPQPLLAFLDDGPPPVYLGFGSMTDRNPQAMTRMVVDALALTGQRAVVLSGWAGLGSADLPPTILQVDAVPHSWLFPRMAAVVHHGGAGTTAAGLRAGVPNFIIPHFADQPFWGQRVHDLGVGPKPVMRHKLTAVKLAQGMETAVSDPQIRQRAAELGEKIREEDGTAVAVQLIEAYVGEDNE